MTADIAVLGAGVMGAAMALPATAAGNTVALVGTPLDGAIVEAVRAGQPHPRLGPYRADYHRHHSRRRRPSCARDRAS